MPSERLAPRIREVLELLWKSPAHTPLESIPPHLEAALSWCLNRRKPRWARIFGIGDVAYVELLAAGSNALWEDQLWDETEAGVNPVWLSKGKVWIGNKSLSLEPQLAAVLGALVKLGSATTRQLQQESGYSEAVALLKKLVKRFPELAPHVHFPGGRGRGGYSTTIKAGQQLP